MIKNDIIEYIFDTKIDNIENKIKYLLELVDEEFIPPLSSREGTTQTKLSSYNKKIELDSYFKSMMNQVNIVMTLDDNLLGFVSFRDNHTVDLLEKYSPCNYLSTIAVNREFRGEKIASNLYDFMIHEVTKKYPSKYLLTRTWSTNYKHINLLNKLGFELVKSIKNQRGDGIDTVYYALKLDQTHLYSLSKF